MRTLSKHTSIRLGDTIRVSGNIYDMQISRVGIVAKRLDDSGATEYLTENGMVILRAERDGTTGIGKLQISLLNPTPQPTLF